MGVKVKVPDCHEVSSRTGSGGENGGRVKVQRSLAPRRIAWTDLEISALRRTEVDRALNWPEILLLARWLGLLLRDRAEAA